MGDSLAPSERHQFTYQGRVIYEWDQTLAEVNIYIQIPDGIKAKELYCDISTRHLRVGIKPNPPYIDAEPWPSALKGHQTNPMKTEEDKKRLLLERFQEEHPGFDFSGAEVTGGNVPNPRTFMGGMNPK